MTTPGYRLVTLILLLLAGLFLPASFAMPRVAPARSGENRKTLADLPPDARKAISTALKREGVSAPAALREPDAVLSNSDQGTLIGRVAISEDTVVVGGVEDGVEVAYVFVKPPGGWRDGVQSAKLIPSDGAGADFFGGSVAIDNNTILIGADGDDIGSNDEQGSTQTGRLTLQYQGARRVRHSSPAASSRQSKSAATCAVRMARATPEPGKARLCNSK